MLLAEHNGAAVYRAKWSDLLGVVPECNTLIADTPYSDRTHAGHGAGVAETTWGAVHKTPPVERRDISYSPWTPEEVRAFVEAWSPRTRGWFVTMTDHVLARAWEEALEDAGRYVFSPLAYVVPGSRVRMAGDGPTQWAIWIVVARPKTKEAAAWRSLPGGYVLPPGQGVDKPIPGGKEPWIMQRLVEDYSTPGDLICDPTCGAGTTAIGAIRSGRRAIVGDMHRPHAELAALWIQHPHRPGPRLEAVPKLAPQGRLF